MVPPAIRVLSAQDAADAAEEERFLDLVRAQRASDEAAAQLAASKHPATAAAAATAKRTKVRSGVLNNNSSSVNSTRLTTPTIQMKRSRVATPTSGVTSPSPMLAES